MLCHQDTIIEIVFYFLILFIKDPVKVCIDLKSNFHRLTGNDIFSIDLILSESQCHDRHHYIRTSSPITAQIKDHIPDLRIFGCLLQS